MLPDLRVFKSQVPAGSLPRTMDVILRNDIVEAVRAGDKVRVLLAQAGHGDWFEGT
jgi:DNA replicative helicase MCM subunit Mcm2 (Cdc46/Mcm family)